MKNEEFVKFRKQLGLTQKQLAQLLVVSLKSIRSYEQGWRTIPDNVERHMLLLVSISRREGKSARLCWTVKKCPLKRKNQCPTWKLKAGHLCWFINGTICEGIPQNTWEEKMRICKKCEMFQFVEKP